MVVMMKMMMMMMMMMACSFFGKFRVLCFLETPVLRFTFLPYYRRGKVMKVDDVTNRLKRKPHTNY